MGRRRADRPLKMAVNVSVRQFDRADLPAMVGEVLAETGMPAGQLCLEMTESVLMTDTEENLARWSGSRRSACTLAIDDFGTGYSSLAYLRRFPVDTLKIDRSFVERLGEQTDDAALARTIVQLGQSLGMATVAEGIEEYGQLAALREMGCDLRPGLLLLPSRTRRRGRPPARVADRRERAAGRRPPEPTSRHARRPYMTPALTATAPAAPARALARRAVPGLPRGHRHADAVPGHRPGHGGAAARRVHPRRCPACGRSTR